MQQPLAVVRLASVLVAVGIAAGAAGCSLVVQGELDDKPDGAAVRDGGRDLPAADTAPGKVIRIEASLEPRSAYPDDPLQLSVLVFGFRLVPPGTAPRSGEGQFLVSFVAGDRKDALFESASRHETFRLSDLAGFAPPAPGDYALEISLRTSDGRAVAPDKAVRLPLTLCDPTRPAPGCAPPP